MALKSLYAGDDCNKVAVGKRTQLLGDPNLKPEKPYTIIGFPGGDVEISRTECDRYWIHVRIDTNATEAISGRTAKIVAARIDCDSQRYCDAGNEAITLELDHGDVTHIAFLIEPQ